MTTIITKWQWFSFQGLSIIQTLECSPLATPQIYQQPLLSVITVINKDVHRHTPCSCLDSLFFIRMRENALRCEMSGMWQLPPPGHQPHSVWRAASHNFYVAHISGRLCFIITQTKSWRGRYIWLFTRSEVRLCWVTSPSPRNSLMSGWGFCDTWGPGTHVTIIVWWYLIAATPVTFIMTGITMLSIDHWCSKVHLWFNKQQQIFYAALIILLEERVQSNIWRQHLTTWRQRIYHSVHWLNLKSS